MDVEEEASEKPIIKNGMSIIFLNPYHLCHCSPFPGNGLNVSMGETAQINGDCTVVTYVGEKEEDDVKKEAPAEEEKEEKKDVEKKVEEEKEEVKEEEKKEENEVEEAKETDPLKEESESK